MRPTSIVAICACSLLAVAKVFDRQPLSYATIPEGTYAPPNKSGETTLLDLIDSRDDLSELAKVVRETPGKDTHTHESRIGLLPG
jgi:hypothetical protein